MQAGRGGGAKKTKAKKRGPLAEYFLSGLNLTEKDDFLKVLIANFLSELMVFAILE
jgi:hypothetical protein